MPKASSTTPKDIEIETPKAETRVFPSALAVRPSETQLT